MGRGDASRVARARRALALGRLARVRGLRWARSQSRLGEGRARRVDSGQPHTVRLPARARPASHGGCASGQAGVESRAAGVLLPRRVRALALGLSAHRGLPRGHDRVGRLRGHAGGPSGGEERPSRRATGGVEGSRLRGRSRVGARETQGERDPDTENARVPLGADLRAGAGDACSMAQTRRRVGDPSGAGHRGGCGGACALLRRAGAMAGVGAR